ncbi:di/tricarboxylate transporter [Pseudomonas sp. TE12234]
MGRSIISPARISDDADSMHSAGYFIDAIGRLFLDLAGEAPDTVEQILNGYTIGGIAAGLRIVGSDLMARGDDLNALLAKLDSREVSK